MDSELEPTEPVLADRTPHEPPDHAQTWTIRRLQAIGLSNDHVEGLMGIKLKPDHRRPD